MPAGKVGADGAAECPLCFELRPLKLFPCHHTYCTSCIESLNRTKANRVECPVCKTITDIPASGPDRLPNSPASLPTSIPGKCEGCSKNKPTDCCVDCQQWFCSACVAVHANTRLSQRHTVVSRAEYVTRGGVENATRSSDPCPSHTSKMLDLYCHSCKKLICAECYTQSHRSYGHDVAAASQKVAEVVRATRAACLRLHGRFLEAERREAGLLRQMSQVQQRVEAMGRGEAEKAAKVSIKQLEADRDKLKKIIDGAFQDQKKRITEMRESAGQDSGHVAAVQGRLDTCKTHVQDMQDLATRAARVVRSGSVKEVFELPGVLERELAKTLPSPAPDLNTLPQLTFPSDLGVKIMKASISVGGSRKATPIQVPAKTPPKSKPPSPPRATPPKARGTARQLSRTSSRASPRNSPSRTSRRSSPGSPGSPGRVRRPRRSVSLPRVPAALATMRSELAPLLHRVEVTASHVAVGAIAVAAALVDHCRKFAAGDTDELPPPVTLSGKCYRDYPVAELVYLPGGPSRQSPGRRLSDLLGGVSSTVRVRDGHLLLEVKGEPHLLLAGVSLIASDRNQGEQGDQGDWWLAASATVGQAVRGALGLAASRVEDKGTGVTVSMSSSVHEWWWQSREKCLAVWR